MVRQVGLSKRYASIWCDATPGCDETVRMLGAYVDPSGNYSGARGLFSGVALFCIVGT